MFLGKLPIWGQKRHFFQKHGFWGNFGRYSYNKDDETENAW